MDDCCSRMIRDGLAAAPEQINMSAYRNQVGSATSFSSGILNFDLQVPLVNVYVKLGLCF